MEITIQDFGPISSITFDLKKDFHLIYGKNSIGKSYSTYCLYCIMKNVIGKPMTRSSYYYHDSIIETQRNQIKNILKPTKNPSSISEKLRDFASAFIEEQLQELLLPGITSSLSNTFSNLQLLKNARSKKPYIISFKLNEKETIKILSDEKGQPYLGKIELLQNWEFIEKKTKSTKYSLLIDGKKAIGCPTEEIFITDLISMLIATVGEKLDIIASDVRDVYYLPASRSGLYQALSSFTPILAELTQNRFFLNSKKIELPSLSEPLSDYFLDISTINKKEVNKRYSKIIEDIEKNILDGSVRYDEETQKIKYKPNNLNFELDISEVSSMIAELSPIVIFLRHILHHKYSRNNPSSYEYFLRRQMSRFREDLYDVIFIEEPEAHLHPEVQVKLTEIFSELTKLNIKIIMTSHSNYMFNKINNIILKNDLKREKVAVYQLIKTENGSIVNEEMSVGEDGISDENFTDVSRKLYEERLDILDD